MFLLYAFIDVTNTQVSRRDTELIRKIIYEFGACTNQLLISGQFRYFKINDIVFMSGRLSCNAKLAEIDFLAVSGKGFL